MSGPVIFLALIVAVVIIGVIAAGVNFNSQARKQVTDEDIERFKNG